MLSYHGADVLSFAAAYARARYGQDRAKGPICQVFRDINGNIDTSKHLRQGFLGSDSLRLPPFCLRRYELSIVPLKLRV